MRVWPTRSARSHKAHQLIAVLIPALIVVLSISGFVWVQKRVQVVVDSRTLQMTTQASTVAELLLEAGVSADSNDLVTPAMDSVLEDGATVVVRHSVPVTLDLNGGRVDVDVVGETVADALVAAGVDPAAHPAIIPSAEASLHPGMVVRVPDVFVRVVKQEATIGATVRREKDPSLPKGSKRVITSGRPGRVMRVYRVLVTNGSEGPRVLTATKVLRKPVERIVAVGTGRTSALKIAADPGPRASKAKASAKPPVGGRRMRVEATAYSPREPGLDFRTATGARATHGVIAVDPRVIPLGTRVYVPGYGYAVAADTGGAIKGSRIDLCFETVAECIRWGRRTITIIVLD
jgi:uncharacterized protein YabE (DUF348 family)